MRVAFRHLDRGVHQDLLQIIDVSALHHEVGGKCMPKIMETDHLGETPNPYKVTNKV